ncbi:carbohydrate ABC transporter permease [Streptomyces shenzhenensis]|uniref:carbohydrate ABC transporter permease n=1 Tax=Streptomyces shenzhenensis TaxID=943815 RepID=UPI0015F069B4|nr:carbohydrate ABC transporter permease [Streptomyces shenzhenensis]
MTTTTVPAHTPASRTRRLPTPGRVLLHLFLAVGSLVMITPFVWMILSSLKTHKELAEFGWLPKSPQWHNYSDAMSVAPFGRYFLNSFVIATGQTALTLLFATAAGYALARIPMRGRGALFTFTLAMLMVPGYVTLIPQFVIVKSMPLFGGNNILGQGGTGWLDTWWALLIPGAIAPFYVFLARQFYLGLPTELAEAARLDGLSEYGIFARILTPLIKPALATIAVFQFQAAWNNFLWPLLVTKDDRMRPIQLGLAVFSQDLNVQWAYLMAGATLAALPMVLLFLCAQRYFIEGIASAGLKG